MTQPLAVALHALSRVAQGPDETVAVIGAGGIGSFIVAGASRRAAEGRVVAIDIDAERLATAAALGASETVDASGRDLAELLLELSDGDRVRRRDRGERRARRAGRGDRRRAPRRARAPRRPARRARASST